LQVQNSSNATATQLANCVLVHAYSRKQSYSCASQLRKHKQKLDRADLSKEHEAFWI